jgi:hypothetical protein
MKRLIMFLCVTFLVVGTQITVSADRYSEGGSEYKVGNYHRALELLQPLAEQGDFNS